MQAQVLDYLATLGIRHQRRNTGAIRSQAGKHVAFGEPGNSDIDGQLPDGRRLEIEIKRPDFDPAKARGAERERFDRQVAKLRECNAHGGVAFWTDNLDLVMRVLPLVLEGWRVEESDDGELRVLPPPEKS